MRVTIGVVAAGLLCLLGGGVIASAAIAPQMANATNAVEPPDDTNAMAADAPESRASQIDACVSEPPIRLPDGVNANLFCSCMVDKRMAIGDGSERDAIFQCAAQLHFDMPALRTSEINECVSGSPGHLPEGADTNAFCTCAVDKMLASTPQQDALNQCATELHITLLSGLSE